MFDLCIILPEARYRSIRKFFKWQRNAIILYEKLLRFQCYFNLGNLCCVKMQLCFHWAYILDISAAESHLRKSYKSMGWRIKGF